MKKIYFKSFITALLLLCSSVASAQTFEDWTSTNTEHGSTSSFTYYFSDDSKSVTFDWSVSSEDNWDWLIVTIDGTQVLKKSGSASGSYTHTFTATGSSHILEVKYTKDNSGSSGSDKAKIYNIKYSRGGRCGTNATWLLTDGTLIIDGTGAMEDFYFDNPDRNAPWPYSVLKNVIIGDNITYIGGEAFRYCRNLTSITIGNSVTSIGSSAFEGCTGLTSITIPNSVTSIGYNTFEGCTGLTSVTIPNSVIRIESNAFYECTGLTNITIPNSVTSIGYQAFDGTAWYNNQADGVVYLGKMLYKYKGTMPANTSITIKDGTLGINNYAFYKCTGLTNITIPNSVTSIGYQAFYGCTGLRIIYNNSSLDITVGSSNHGYVAYYANAVITPNSNMQSDFIFKTTDGKHTLTGYIGNDSIISLPENYNGENYSIGNAVFQNNKNITSITIPNSVISIGEKAYYNCTGLTSVTIGNSVTSIGNEAFRGCTGLKSITIPNSVISIGEEAFYDCDGLTSVTIGNSVTSIGRYAFYSCDGLTSITIPNSVTSIGYEAFYSCDGLTSATIGNSVTSIGDKAFYYCDGLTSVTIGNSVTSIGDEAFNYCTKLTAVHISDLSAWCKIDFDDSYSNPLYYAKNLYLNGEKITDLVIPSDITEIKDYAFEYCSGLTSIEIPNSVTSIGSYAFSGCTGLRIVYNNSSLDITAGSSNHGNVAYYAYFIVTKDDDIKGDFIFRTADNTNTLIAYAGNDSVITLPENYNDENYAIGEKAFRNCTGLTSITIPNSVTTIGGYAFRNCTGLTSVTIGSSVTRIGNEAFSGCTGLTNVTIPNSVTTIGDYAFSNCTGLKSITIGNGVTTIVSNTFLDCTGLNSVTIPESVEEIEANAFKGCTSITEIYSMAEVPAVITETSFHNYSATLYVPYGAKRLYKITDGWSNFTNIVEMEVVEDPEEERLVGDVDGDGSIDIADVTALVEIILGTKQ